MWWGVGGGEGGVQPAGRAERAWGQLREASSTMRLEPSRRHNHKHHSDLEISEEHRDGRGVLDMGEAGAQEVVGGSVVVPGTPGQRGWVLAVKREKRRKNNSRWSSQSSTQKEKKEDRSTSE